MRTRTRQILAWAARRRETMPRGDSDRARVAAGLRRDRDYYGHRAVVGMLDLHPSPKAEPALFVVYAACSDGRRCRYCVPCPRAEAERTATELRAGGFAGVQVVRSGD